MPRRSFAERRLDQCRVLCNETIECERKKQPTTAVFCWEDQYSNGTGFRTGGRAVEGTALEKPQAGNRLVSSNLTLSANKRDLLYRRAAAARQTA